LEVGKIKKRRKTRPYPDGGEGVKGPTNYRGGILVRGGLGTGGRPEKISGRKKKACWLPRGPGVTGGFSRG